MTEFDSYQIIDNLKISVSSNERIGLTNNVDKLYLKKIVEKYGNKYSKYGFIYSNGIKLLEYSKPYLDGSGFTCNMCVNVKISARICLPCRGMKFVGNVTSNTRPIITIEKSKIHGLILKQSNSDMYNNVVVGTKIESEIESVEITDKGIICICKNPTIFTSEEQLTELSIPADNILYDGIDVCFTEKPKIIDGNISEEDLKKFYGQNGCKPTLNVENAIGLNKIKNMYFNKLTTDGKLDEDKMRIIKQFTHKYYYVQNKKDNIFFNLPYTISKAYYKMIEIINVLELNLKNYDNVVCLAEGPGGFIQALVEKVKIGNIYGYTYKNPDADVNHNLNWNIKKINSYGNVHVSSNDDGDLTDFEYAQTIINKHNNDNNNDKVSFITADGTIEGYSYQLMELDNFRLIFAEIFVALQIQKDNGIFVFKIHDTFYNSTITLIKLLYKYYKKICVYKPYTSPEDSSEKYIVCFNFIEDNIHEDINDLNTLYKNIMRSDKKDMYVTSLTNLDINDKLLNELEKINNNRISEQKLSFHASENIYDLLSDVTSKKPLLDKISTLSVICKTWFNKFNINYTEKENQLHKTINTLFSQFNDVREILNDPLNALNLHTTNPDTMFKLLENMPELQYTAKTQVEKVSAKKRIRHWGQLKLLMSEIYFLLNVYKKENNWPSKYVVYAGGAPGTHMSYLSKLFPDLCFILIDPRNFEFPKWFSDVSTNIKEFTNIQDVLSDKETKIFTLKGYLTANENDNEISIHDSDAYIPASIFKELNPMFISDIRSISEEKDASFDTLSELSVLFDNLRHIDVLRLMDPCYSLIKFRCTYGKVFDNFDINNVEQSYKSNSYYDDVLANFEKYKIESPYPEGVIYLQCWQGMSSTETRLFVEKSNNTNIKYYNNIKYENQLYHFNNKERLSEYKNYYITGDKSIDTSYDMTYHIYILKEYQKLFEEENQSLKDFSDELTNLITMDGKRNILTIEGDAKYNVVKHIDKNTK